MLANIKGKVDMKIINLVIPNDNPGLFFKDKFILKVIIGTNIFINRLIKI